MKILVLDGTSRRHNAVSSTRRPIKRPSTLAKAERSSIRGVKNVGDRRASCQQRSAIGGSSR
uniref:Uncharacterized protein n=1 Tax=Romanomermis culicivorax TaxID=13658 RepID=A0A915ICG9_ROMCU